MKIKQRWIAAHNGSRTLANLDLILSAGVILWIAKQYYDDYKDLKRERAVLADPSLESSLYPN
jgi:hypothetical protein